MLCTQMLYCLVFLTSLMVLRLRLMRQFYILQHARHAGCFISISSLSNNKERVLHLQLLQVQNECMQSTYSQKCG